MTVTAIWLQRPASVLLLAKGENHPLIPYVRRIPRARYWQAAGRQAGYNERMRAEWVAPVDHMRLDVQCPRVVDIRHDWRGVRYAVASPLLAIGLLWTQRGSEQVDRDMRWLFSDPADAELATDIAVRSLEQLGRSTGTLTFNQ